MDVNGTRFHLLQGERDWLPLLVEQQADKIWWDRARQQLTLAPAILEIPASAGDAVYGPAQRRGASYDHYRNVYWLGPEQDRILYRPAATPNQVATFWSVDRLHDACERDAKASAFRPCQSSNDTPSPVLRGLTVTTREYLVVGTMQPAGLLVFDLHAGGPPHWMLWPHGVTFAPFDMAPAPDGGVWILDRNAIAPHQFWRLDRFFQVMPCSGFSIEVQPAGNASFKPVRGQLQPRDARYMPGGITLQMSSPLAAIDPYAIEVLPDGSVLILETGDGDTPSNIHHFIDGELNASIALDRDVLGALISASELRGHDFSFVQDSAYAGAGLQGSLYLIALNGKQAFKFTLRLGKKQIELSMRPDFLPLRQYGGKGVIGAFGEVFYDFQDNWLPLAAQPRRRYKTTTNAGTLPSLEGIVFDGREPEQVWHRLVLDACIPDGTAIEIESRAANERIVLQDVPWSQEPSLYRRADGSELPYHEPFADHSDRDRATGSWELLFQSARGRYLELRLTLQGTGRNSPRIQSLRAYYPRFSYLHEYLPAVYREDSRSASFLDRFLANVEGLYTVLEGQIELAEVLLDSRTAPAEYLEWLAGWFGAMMDPSWNDRRRRLFLDFAELLFRWRGTQIGMRAAIRLAIDPCPDATIFDELLKGRSATLGTMGGRSVRIAEDFLARSNPGVAIGDPTAPKTLALTAADEPWTPLQGAAPLHRRFREFLRFNYRDKGDDSAILSHLNSHWGRDYPSVEAIVFPPLLPGEETFARDWLIFTRDAIGFTYAAVDSSDTAAYQEFLARRYRQIDRLNEAYLLAGTQPYESFGAIAPPESLPDSDKPLADWIEFVSLVLPIKRNAYRFSVLVPTELHESYYERLRRMAQVEGIVAREKPAHTDFEVKLYWAMFQIGSARLGLDTSIGEGSRYVALVLGSNYLGQSYLSESHPWGVDGRTVIGRDRIFNNRPMRE